MQLVFGSLCQIYHLWIAFHETLINWHDLRRLSTVKH